MPEETREEGRKWVSAKEAAAMLELESPWLIYRLRYKKQLTGYTLPGVNALRFLRTDIEQLMRPAPHVYTPRAQKNDQRRPAPAEV